MNRFRILIGIMMFVLAVSLCVGSAAYAQGQGQGQAGLLTIQAELDQEKIDRAAGDATLQQAITDEATTRASEDALLQQQIDTIEQTPWTDTNDGYNSISTIGSIKVGDDQNRDYCDTRNEGTIRYNTATKAFEGCNSIAWVTLSSSGSDGVLYAIGDTGPAGGIVFHTTDGGLHGLEAAPADHSSGAPWGCLGTLIDGAAVGTGAQNTADILAGCSEAGTAAKIADAYSLGGYNDWFLPSKDELNLLYQQRAVVGGFSNYGYWSSTEGSSDYAWYQSVFDGDQYFTSKGGRGRRTQSACC